MGIERSASSLRDKLDLSGRVSLVIGAASGIGLASAKALAELGSSVVLGDVQESVRDAAATINSEGGVADFVAVDVLDDDSVERAVLETESRFGGLDILVNSAGQVSSGAGAFLKNVDMFLNGVWRGVHFAVPAMQRRGGGSIVNVASIAGLIGSRGAEGYGPAKHGVIGITKTWALAHVADGIRVNAVCPGFVVTGMTEAYLRVDGDRGGIEDIVSQQDVPMARWGRSDEIAAAVAFLASDAASFVTGHALVVDGGLIA